jgi:hypothetical protein
LKLQDELASTENQILTARTRFNEAVKPYNSHIKTFPNSLFAGLFGFKEKHISTLLKVQTNQLSKILNPPKSLRRDEVKKELK